MVGGRVMDGGAEVYEVNVEMGTLGQCADITTVVCGLV